MKFFILPFADKAKFCSELTLFKLVVMKIATYNVNGINGRLPVLLKWLEESTPDVVCLQELKAPQEKFPENAIIEAGYDAIWHGQKSWNGVAILSRVGKPEEIRRALPGDDQDTHSRYIEAAINDILIGCLYLPNGNPAPGPKFDYKLNWFVRFNKHASTLLKSRQPVVLTGDYNVMPTELDVYKPERWVKDALFRPNPVMHLKSWLTRAGRMPSENYILAKQFILFGIISAMPMAATPGCASIIFY